MQKRLSLIKKTGWMVQSLLVQVTTAVKNSVISLFFWGEGGKYRSVNSEGKVVE